MNFRIWDRGGGRRGDVGLVAMHKVPALFPLLSFVSFQVRWLWLAVVLGCCFFLVALYESRRRVIDGKSEKSVVAEVKCW